MFGENLVQRLLLPEVVVGWVVHDLGGEADLFQAVQPRHLARRAGAQPGIIIIIVIGPPWDVAGPSGFLAVKICEAVETKRAIVKPIVAPPAIDHGIDRDRRAQCRMRINQRHQRSKSIVGNPENTHLAVGLRDVLDQPIDGVVGVGGVIDVARVERPAQRPCHHISAFRAVLAAHILHHANVAAVEHGIVGDVVVVDERG